MTKEALEHLADLEHQCRMERTSVRLQPFMMDPRSGQAEGAVAAAQRAEDAFFAALDELTPAERAEYSEYRKIAF